MSAEGADRLLRSHGAESLVRSGWVTRIGVKEMVVVARVTCVARGSGDGAPGRTPAPNSHAVLDYYLEVG